MPRYSVDTIINIFKTDLLVLSEILENRDISVAGPGHIQRAAYHLLSYEGSKKFISFAVSDIDLKIDTSGHRRPASVIVEDRLLVDIIFKQDCTDWQAIAKPFEGIIENEILFRIRGVRGSRTLLSTWHFDRHGYPPNTDSPCHPTYHFQFGGRELAEVADNIDGVLIMDTPRHFAPPMDPVLAIDVLLSHFNGPKWHSIRNEDPRYKGIVRRAQVRLWKPYFDEILSDLSPVSENSPIRLSGLLPNIL